MKSTIALIFLASAVSCASPQERTSPDVEKWQPAGITDRGFLIEEGSNLHFSGSLSIYEREDLDNRLKQFQESIKESSLEGFSGSLDSNTADYLGYSYVKEANGSNGVSVWVLILGSEEISLDFSDQERRAEWLITKYETTEIGPDARVYHFQGRSTEAHLREDCVLSMRLQAGAGRKMNVNI